MKTVRWTDPNGITEYRCVYNDFYDSIRFEQLLYGKNGKEHWVSFAPSVEVLVKGMRSLMRCNRPIEA